MVMSTKWLGGSDISQLVKKEWRNHTCRLFQFDYNSTEFLAEDIVYRDVVVLRCVVISSCLNNKALEHASFHIWVGLGFRATLEGGSGEHSRAQDVVDKRQSCRHMYFDVREIELMVRLPAKRCNA